MVSALPIKVNLFRSALRLVFETPNSTTKWYRMNEKPIGLAISGGVDSMALAALCSRLDDCSFHAFVVDHGARQGSEKEAEAVKREVTRLGIPTSVLKLEWPSEGKPSDLSNFETAARKLRYQALGQACAERGISALCLAHHEDDQIETFLMRLTSGQHGKSGLLGMKASSEIPECFGMYGVSQSGIWDKLYPNTKQSFSLAHAMSNGLPEPLTARMRSLQQKESREIENLAQCRDRTTEEICQLRHDRETIADGLSSQQTRPLSVRGVTVSCMRYESGGVQIYRPFLIFGKDRLVATCQQNSIPWFEDNTNQDQTLTQRNAIRHIINNHKLPQALSKSRIATRLRRIQEKNSEVERNALLIFNQCLITRIDISQGLLCVRLPLLNRTGLHPDSILGALRQLIEIVSPNAVVGTTKLATLRDIMWPEEPLLEKAFGNEQNKFTISGVLLIRKKAPIWDYKGWDKIHPEVRLDPHFSWELLRQPCSLRERHKLTTVFPPVGVSSIKGEKSSRWQLWDGRFWIRIWHEMRETAVFVREYRKDDEEAFLKSLDKTAVETLKKRMRGTPLGCRPTLPAIVMGDGNEGGVNRVLALPSKGIHVPNMFFEEGPMSYRIIYKQLNIDDHLNQYYHLEEVDYNFLPRRVSYSHEALRLGETVRQIPTEQ